MTPSSNSGRWRRGGTSESWVSVLDESIQEWINLYTFPGWIFVPCKPHPFGNKYHTIVCALYKVIYHVEIIEGEDCKRGIGSKDLTIRG